MEDLLHEGAMKLHTLPPEFARQLGHAHRTGRLLQRSSSWSRRQAGTAHRPKPAAVDVHHSSPSKHGTRRDHIFVTGTYRGPANTGVVVNASRPYARGSFYANNVPLERGRNVLELSPPPPSGARARTAVFTCQRPGAATDRDARPRARRADHDFTCLPAPVVRGGSAWISTATASRTWSCADPPPRRCTSPIASGTVRGTSDGDGRDGGEVDRHLCRPRCSTASRTTSCCSRSSRA